MEILNCHNIEEFLRHNEELLLKKESFYNLILGLSYLIRDKKLETTEPLFYSVLDGDKVVGAVLRSNHDKPVILTEMPLEALDLLIEELSERGVHLAAVTGAEEVVVHFKDKWCEKFKISSKLGMHLGVYENYKLIKPQNIAGEMIVMAPEHKELVRVYTRGFLQECMIDGSGEEEIEKLITKHLNQQTLFLLKSPEGELVSMAANTRGTINGGTVSLVYTPHHLRGKGLASAMVGLLTEKILTHKKFASLFTDLSNPTSNSIYQKLGYVKIGNNIHYNFIYSDDA